MNKRVICARASALFATAASAAPLSSGRAAIPDNSIENDRMVGGQYGRCWRDRGQHVGWVERNDTHPDGDDRGGLREALAPSCDLVPDRLFHLPDGQITDSLSSPFRKNILIFRRRKSVYIHHRPVPQRGGSRSSRTRDRMRWTQAAPKTRALNCGRQNRVVLTPRRWRQAREKQASQG